MLGAEKIICHRKQSTPKYKCVMNEQVVGVEKKPYDVLELCK